MGWEKVTGTDSDRTERLKVDGGALYRTIIQGTATGKHQPPAVAMVFVPDPDHRVEHIDMGDFDEDHHAPVHQ